MNGEASLPIATAPSSVVGVNSVASSSPAMAYGGNGFSKGGIPFLQPIQNMVALPPMHSLIRDDVSSPSSGIVNNVTSITDTPGGQLSIPQAVFGPGYIANSKKKPIPTINTQQANIVENGQQQQLASPPSEGHTPNQSQIPQFPALQQTGEANDFNGTLASHALSLDQPRMACINCRKSHRKCDKVSPCGECKRRGIQHECIFSEPKKRGPKIKTPDDNATSPNTQGKEAKKRKVFKETQSSMPYEASFMPRLITEASMPSASFPSTNPDDIILTRKEIDRRNYILQMIGYSCNYENQFKLEESLTFMLSFFKRDDFICFLCDCLDINHREMLSSFIRDRILAVMEQRLSDTFYQGIYFAFEALYLKYHSLFVLPAFDENRPILLSECEKSIRWSKKEIYKYFDAPKNLDIDKTICFTWASYINVIFERNSSLSISILNNALENLFKGITNNHTESSEVLTNLSKQYILFTKYVLCAEIYQNITELPHGNSIEFKRLVIRTIQLTFILRFTSSYQYMFIGEVDGLKNHQILCNILPPNNNSDLQSIRKVLKDMECFIPRSLKECWSFISPLNQQVISTNSADILFWQFLIQYIKTKIALLSTESTTTDVKSNLQMIQTLISHMFAILDISTLTPTIYLSIVINCARDLFACPHADTKEECRKCIQKITPYLASSKEGNHTRAATNLFLSRNEDILEIWKQIERGYLY